MVANLYRYVAPYTEYAMMKSRSLVLDTGESFFDSQSTLNFVPAAVCNGDL